MTTTATQDILVHTEAGVTTLTLNRADKKNSLTRAMYAALADALEQAQANDAVRAVLLQGDMAVFSAGNDIADFLQAPPTALDAPVFRFLRNVSAFTKPVIAAVCGPAVGIGTTLLFHCDLVYAGDNAAFSMPFVNLGVCPEAASSLLAPQRMGYGRAAEALLLGDPFTAEAALEMGLVSRIVPPTEANALAQRQAQRLVTKPSTAVLETKRLMKLSQASAVEQRMTEEAVIFGRMLGEPASKEAFSAFLGKRKPDFSKL